MCYYYFYCKNDFIFIYGWSQTCIVRATSNPAGYSINLENNIFCRDECLPQYNCVITATNEREVIDISPYFPLVREKYFIVPELLIPRFV